MTGRVVGAEVGRVKVSIDTRGGQVWLGLRHSCGEGAIMITRAEAEELLLAALSALRLSGLYSAGEES